MARASRNRTNDGGDPPARGLPQRNDAGNNPPTATEDQNQTPSNDTGHTGASGIPPDRRQQSPANVTSSTANSGNSPPASERPTEVINNNSNTGGNSEPNSTRVPIEGDVPIGRDNNVGNEQAPLHDQKAILARELLNTLQKMERSDLFPGMRYTEVTTDELLDTLAMSQDANAPLLPMVTPSTNSRNVSFNEYVNYSDVVQNRDVRQNTDARQTGHKNHTDGNVTTDLGFNTSRSRDSVSSVASIQTIQKLEQVITNLKRLQMLLPVVLPPDFSAPRNFYFNYLFPGPPDMNGKQKDTWIPNTFDGCNINQREVNDIQIHIIGYYGILDRLVNLLAKLAACNYDGWAAAIPLHLHTEAELSREKKTSFRSLQWEHGPLIVHNEHESMFFDSIGGNAGVNTIYILLEETALFDLSYFQWLLASIYHYGQNPKCRDAHLIGFSLHPFSASGVTGLNNRSSTRTNSLLLSTQPSLLGGAFWANHLVEFGRFLRFRTNVHDKNGTRDAAPESFEILSVSQGNLPSFGSLKGKVFPNGWKQLMREYMFGRNLFMLYPRHSHVPAGELQNVNQRTTPQLVQRFNTSKSRTYFPEYGKLDIFGADCKRTSKERLAAQGAMLLTDFANACPTCIAPLLSAWTSHKWQTHQKSATSYPEICVADLYTSSSSHAIATNHTRNNDWQDGRKFLLFEPQYGTNNQLLAIVKAYAWAESLERTLVLPPLFFPRASNFNYSGDTSEWIDFDHFFKISRNGFRKNVRFLSRGFKQNPISFFKFRDLKHTPSRLLIISKEALFDNSSTLLMSALDVVEYDIVNLRHIFDHKVSWQKVRHLLGGCQDAVLAFDGMFFTDMEDIRPWTIWPDVLKLNKRIMAEISVMKDKLSEELGTNDYNCYHVRSGDFEKVCKRMENPTPLDRQIIPKDYFEVVEEQGALCWVTAQDVCTALQEDDMPALVLSDNPVALEDRLEKIPVHSKTSTWVANALSMGQEKESPESKLLALVVEQELCSAANIAVLNQLSTVSWRIQKLRRDKDFRYWRKKQSFLHMRAVGFLLFSAMALTLKVFKSGKSWSWTS